MNDQSKNTLSQWLLENGGPSGRYQTATDLMDGRAAVDLAALAHDLFESPQVSRWLGHLKTVRAIHGSRNWELENPVGKLLDLGLKAGMIPAFDQAMRPYREYFAANQGTGTGGVDRLSGAIIASCLARAGYHQDEGLRGFLLERLDEMYKATRARSYAIYDDPKAWPDMPAVYRKRYRVIAQRFAPNGNLRLPYIHDIYALSAFPEALRTSEVDRKIRSVVGYVLTDEYQSFTPSYGFLRNERNGRGRYIVAGWAVALPGYRGFEFGNHGAAYFVQRMELMTHFPVARKSAWFARSLRHLEGFQTPRGTFLFPRSYLVEKPVGYWVTGAHMGIEEDRRSIRALEIESTFRLLRIRRVACTTGSPNQATGGDAQ